MSLSISVFRGEVRVDGENVVAKQRYLLRSETTRIPVDAVTSVEITEKGPWPLLLLGGYIALSGLVGGYLYEEVDRGAMAFLVGVSIMYAYYLLRLYTVRVSSPTGEIKGRSRSKEKLDRFASRLEARQQDGTPQAGSAATGAVARIQEKVDSPSEPRR